MDNPNNENRSVIFLDTNILHNIGSYLRIAQRDLLPPYSPDNRNFDDIKQILRNSMPGGIAEGILNGCKALAYLQLQCSQVQEDGAVLYTSRLSKSEMLFGVLDGQAHARMAREGIPYRMRQRQSDLSELVSSRLDPNDYHAAVDEIDHIFQDFNDHLANINYVESEGNISDIATLSEFLQGKLFLDVIDCWIFAGSMVVQSRFLLTLDGYLKKTANRLSRPENEDDVLKQREWIALKNELKGFLRTLLRWDAGQEPLFPEVIGFPTGVPTPW